MKRQTVEFNADENGMKLMAVFIAQLVREQVTFDVEEFNDTYNVILTGGF